MFIKTDTWYPIQANYMQLVHMQAVSSMFMITFRRLSLDFIIKLPACKPMKIGTVQSLLDVQEVI